VPLGNLHLLRLFPMQSLDENSKSSIDLNLASIYASSAARLSDSTMVSHAIYVAAAQGFKTDAILKLCTTGWVDIMNVR